MKILHTDVKYPDGYKIRPGDMVEIIAPTKERIGVYVAMDGYRGDGVRCASCVLRPRNTGNPCPMPYNSYGWSLCMDTNIFLKPVEDILEDL